MIPSTPSSSSYATCPYKVSDKRKEPLLKQLGIRAKIMQDVQKTAAAKSQAIDPLAQELDELSLSYQRGDVRPQSVGSAYRDMYDLSNEQAGIYEKLVTQQEKLVEAHDTLMAKLKKHLPAQGYGVQIEVVDEALIKAHKKFYTHFTQQGKETSNYHAIDSNYLYLNEQLKKALEAKGTDAVYTTYQPWPLSKAFQTQNRQIQEMLRLYDQGQEVQTRALKAQAAVAKSLKAYRHAPSNMLNAIEVHQALSQLKTAYECQAAVYDMLVDHQRSMYKSEENILSRQQPLLKTLGELLSKPATPDASKDTTADSSQSAPTLDRVG